MGMDPFVVFPAEWAAAGFGMHATPPTLHDPSGYLPFHFSPEGQGTNYESPEE